MEWNKLGMSYPPHQMMQEVVASHPIRIRIDNLPPTKGWRQIKGFLSQFVPYEQVLNVKVLPLIPSMTPPFIPLQSCIVLLRQDTDWPSLLMHLNGIQWDYYTMMAWVLPNFIPQDSGPLMAVSPPDSSGSSHKNKGHHYDQTDRQKHAARLPLHAFTGPAMPILPGGEQPVQHPSKRLTQIFNEGAFRRQMSQRNMHQLQISNFPPCLHWDEVVKTKQIKLESGGDNQRGDAGAGVPSHHVIQPHVLQDENNEIVPDLTIMTAHPEKYGKLKWTILKDFIKLKCPKLLEIDHKSQGAALSNTREFYVGVYENSESHVEIILLPSDKPDRIIEGPVNQEEAQAAGGADPQRFKVRATLFQAVLGFHSKELCDLCLDAINGEEYMLGYKLQVQRLAKLSST
ncbi:AaceriADL068Wp [[Ashbya] aceris (nom. inval.)]|nr:AaceriADL068Wp [[Ashbya] aceris (nom. inval.)]